MKIFSWKEIAALDQFHCTVIKIHSLVIAMTSTGHVSEKNYKKYLIHDHYAFLHTLFVGGTSLTLNPCIEAANCNTKVIKNKFISVVI